MMNRLKLVFKFVFRLGSVRCGFNKGGNKVDANRFKNKTQKNLLGLWIRAFGQSLAVLFVLLWLWLFFGGTGERGVVFFGLKSCEKGMLLRKKTILHELCYWNSTNNKLQFYSSFKMTRDASVQIDLIKTLQHRQSVAKWRSGNHDLRIETGRHCFPKIPESVRICQHCSSNNIENELHIIFDCRSLHSHAREKLFASDITFEYPIFTNLNTTYELKHCFSSLM